MTPETPVNCRYAHFIVCLIVVSMAAFILSIKKSLVIPRSDILENKSIPRDVILMEDEELSYCKSLKHLYHFHNYSRNCVYTGAAGGYGNLMTQLEVAIPTFLCQHPSGTFCIQRSSYSTDTIKVIESDNVVVRDYCDVDRCEPMKNIAWKTIDANELSLQGIEKQVARSKTKKYSIINSIKHFMTYKPENFADSALLKGKSFRILDLHSIHLRFGDSSFKNLDAEAKKRKYHKIVNFGKICEAPLFSERCKRWFGCIISDALKKSRLPYVHIATDSPLLLASFLEEQPHYSDAVVFPHSLRQLEHIHHRNRSVVDSVKNMSTEYGVARDWLFIQQSKAITPSRSTFSTSAIILSNATVYRMGDGNCSRYYPDNLAAVESYQFFNDISAQWWSMMKYRFAYTQREYVNYEENKISGINAHDMKFNIYTDPTFSCLHERRIGRLGDGGKWVCDPHRIAEQESCLVYSIGSAGDFSFEEDILRKISKRCEIHTFDPTLKGTPDVPPGIHFHALGLAETDGDNYMTLGTLMKKLNHVGRRIDIFKIDCEGCEYSTYKGWFEELSSKSFNIQQLLVEIHPERKNKKFELFEYIKSRGYVIFHKEPNSLMNGHFIEVAWIKLEKSFQSVDNSILLRPRGVRDEERSRAWNESCGFFDDISDQDWALIIERIKNTPNYIDYPLSGVYFDNMNKSHHWYQNNWDPVFTCPHVRRVGPPPLWGKWVCDPHRIRDANECLVYSFSSDPQATFELSVRDSVSPDCEIHRFVIAGKETNNTIAYDEHTLPPPAPNSGSLWRLNNLVDDLGHKENLIDLIVVDWDDLLDTHYLWFKLENLNARQIIVTLNDRTPGPATKFLDYIHSHGYTLFYKEFQNKATFVTLSFIRLRYDTNRF